MAFTLCWDCRCSTTGECRWSRRLKPVKGWEAEENQNGYFVNSCPEFTRNSWGGGKYRYEEDFLEAERKSLENRLRKEKAREKARQKKKKESKTMNKLTIIGNLTGDPETRVTQNGKSVCTFSVAVNRRGQDEADFFRVSAWDRQGENCQKYLSKGRKVCVVGPVTVHTYTDAKGTARASMEVTAQDVEFLSAKSEAPQDKGGFTQVNVNDVLPWET